MSAQTKIAIDAAIRAHVADDYPDNLVSSYVVILERVIPEDDDMTHVVDIVPDGQSNVTTVGLSHFRRDGPHTSRLTRVNPHTIPTDSQQVWQRSNPSS